MEGEVRRRRARRVQANTNQGDAGRSFRGKRSMGAYLLDLC